MPAPIIYSTTGAALSADEIAFAQRVAASFSLGMGAGWAKTVRQVDPNTGVIAEYHAGKNIVYVTPGGFICGYATDGFGTYPVTWGLTDVEPRMLNMPEWAATAITTDCRKNLISGAAFDATFTQYTPAMWVGGSPRWLDSSMYRARGHGVSTDGKYVVGSESGDTTAFVWGVDGSVAYLSLPPDDGSGGGLRGRPVAASNGAKVVVGSVTTTNVYPAYWVDGEYSVIVDTPPSGPGIAVGVSSDGLVIVGWYRNTSGFDDTFRWTSESGMVRIVSVTDADVYPRGVSADGSVVVGDIWYDAGGDEGFVWQEGLGVVLLGIGSVVNGVSSDGKLVIGTWMGAPAKWIVGESSADRVELHVPDDYTSAVAVAAS